MSIVIASLRQHKLCQKDFPEFYHIIYGEVVQQKEQFLATLSIIYLLFYYWLHWIFAAQTFSSGREYVLLSSCGARASHCCDLSCQRAQALHAWAQQLWCSGLVAQQYMESSHTKDQTCVPCTGRWIFIPCIIRKVLLMCVCVCVCVCGYMFLCCCFNFSLFPFLTFQN